MGYSFKINHENKYVHYSHKGTIERKEIGEAWTELLNMSEFTKEKYNLLSDYREGVFNFSCSEIKEIEDFLTLNKGILNGKKNAVIVVAPEETVISFLFENDISKRILFNVKTFSTINAATNFLITN